MILIYQMGKVASVAIRETLTRELPGEDIRHVHVIAEHALWRDIHERARVFGDLGAAALNSIRKVAENGERALAGFNARHGDVPLRVISGIREPLDYAISAFFQNIELVTPDVAVPAAPDAAWIAGTQRRFIGQLESFLNDTTPASGAELFTRQMWRYATGWFEYEFEPLLQLDMALFAAAATRGSAQVQAGNFDVLVYRYEDARDRLEPALVKFLAAPGLKLSAENRSRDKKYSAAYAGFVEALRVPRQLLEPLYAARQVRNFYNEVEIAAFIARRAGH